MSAVGSLGHSDIDGLTLAARDRESRRLIGETFGRSVILSVAKLFTPPDVEAFLTAARESDQIWYAGGTPDVLERIFDVTKSLLPETRVHWQAFVDGQIARMRGNVTEYYAYPGLQQKLADNPEA